MSEKTAKRRKTGPPLSSAPTMELDSPKDTTGGAGDGAGFGAGEREDICGHEAGVPGEEDTEKHECAPPGYVEGENLQYAGEVCSNGYVSEGFGGGEEDWYSEEDWSSEEDEDMHLEMLRGITDMPGQAIQESEDEMALVSGNPEILEANQKDDSRLPELHKEKMTQLRTTLDGKGPSDLVRCAGIQEMLCTWYGLGEGSSSSIYRQQIQTMEERLTTQGEELEQLRTQVGEMRRQLSKMEEMRMQVTTQGEELEQLRTQTDGRDAQADECIHDLISGFPRRCSFIGSYCP